MRSTFSGLNTATRGLYAQQMALDTTGHNISNANTEGFSRQRVNTATTRPDTIYGGIGSMQVGTGVSVDTVTRARNTFLDQQMWKESSALGYGLTSDNTWGKVEGVFKEEAPDFGVQTVLNNFWNSWQTLSTYSSNNSSRTAVRERGAELVGAIKHAGQQLENLVKDTNENLVVKVADINDMSSQIFSLNRQISNIEVNDRDHANDLRDKRDLIVDKLSRIGNVRVYENNNHGYIVQLGNVTLVDASRVTKLGVAASPDPDYNYEVRDVVVEGSVPLQKVEVNSGELHAMQEANTTLAKGYMDKLATVSRFLLQEFNGVHRAGYGSDNSTGHNFFGTANVDYKAASQMKNGEWMKALKINDELYDANGLAKIAAKTSEIKSVIQSNANGGKGTVSGTYIPSAGNADKYMNFQLSMTAGGLQYTIRDEKNNVLETNLATIDGAGSYTLPYGLTFSIASPGASVGDSYSFSVPQGNASGDNATLLANALKEPTDANSSVLKGAALDDYYSSMIADLGIKAQSRKRLADNQQALVNQINGWRQSVSGVNIDEEMTDMIRFQKGYNAAARVVTSMDEMLDKLINGTGLVGR
ncbi:MAG: flagellar hook-associated protein FlgK [Firmicutes bacterium]|nr:flagellar hook-associated protein FlgK [Bacillota bacterium]